MPALAELPPDALKVAYEAANALLSHRAYRPSGLLAARISKFRSEVAGALDPDTGRLPQRSRDHYSLGELTGIELDSVGGPVAVLLQDRFTAVMGDTALPRMLRDLDAEVTQQKAERAQLRAEVDAKAPAAS